MPVVASGGAGDARPLRGRGARGGADAVLAASRFHFGELTIREVKEYLRDRGVEVRL